MKRLAARRNMRSSAIGWRAVLSCTQETTQSSHTHLMPPSACRAQVSRYYATVGAAGDGGHSVTEQPENPDV
eukprot:850928-Prymnesium_polylepis.1